MSEPQQMQMSLLAPETPQKKPTPKKEATPAPIKAATTTAITSPPKVKQQARSTANLPGIATGPKNKAPRKRVTAEKMSSAQRDISISEFFSKNRHLLGFDNASRALLTSVKEAVDNSLDACEEGGILPDICVRITEVGENRFIMKVEDNGPGIVKAQLPKVFGKLLYGSKFHRLRQSRGQQGIGISAAGMYGQLTTGKPVIVTSKTGKNRPAHHYHLSIDTRTNKPVISFEDTFEWDHRNHGTAVQIEMEAVYKGGKRSVDEYIQQVAMANPHARLEYWAPGKKPIVYPRIADELPPEAVEIKPHPHGIELGALLMMTETSKAKTLSLFLQSEFTRVSAKIAEEVCKIAQVPHTRALNRIKQSEVEAVFAAIKKVKIMSPPTTCLVPIGEESMLEGLKAILVQQHFLAEEAKTRKKKNEEQDEEEGALPGLDAVTLAEDRVTHALKEVSATQKSGEETEEEAEVAAPEGSEEAVPQNIVTDTRSIETTREQGKSSVIDVFGKPTFITAVTRPPKVYRGNPFQVEAAIAYGGELNGDDLATVYRYANRVPLLYQQGACAMSQAVMRTKWKNYHVDQARGALPSGPILITVHIASVWVPFTSEAKEAVAHYDEIISELKFALQEAGRRLARYLKRKRRLADDQKKTRYIEKYIPHIGEALQEILGLSDEKRDETVTELVAILERTRNN
ncbi:DNA topoisomerase VI subunit B [Myxococcota bacterium]|nr:DNA topoisomerase VI subunit B [Myxococcota bacterium]